MPTTSGFARLVLAAAVLMAGATAAPADARKAISSCKTRGSKTVVSAGSARVYTKRGPKRPASADPSTVTSLCATLGRRRPMRLATRAVYSAGTLGFRNVLLAGGFAGAVTTSDDRGGYSEELEVFDLRRRRRTARVSPQQEARFTDVVLTPGGDVAWIQTAPAPGQPADAEPQFNSFEVRTRQGVLDSGPTVVKDSLAYSGGTLYWRNANRVGTARLP